LVLEYLQNTYSPHGQQDHMTMPLGKKSSNIPHFRWYFSGKRENL